MIFTKRTLVNSVLAEARRIEDYMGGLPSGDAEEMDAEFYAEFAKPIWDEVEILMNFAAEADPLARNKWAFDLDLGRQEIEWMNANVGKRASVDQVKAALASEYNTDDIDRMVYATLVKHKLRSIKDYEDLADRLFSDYVRHAARQTV